MIRVVVRASREGRARLVTAFTSCLYRGGCAAHSAFFALVRLIRAKALMVTAMLAHPIHGLEHTLIIDLFGWARRFGIVTFVHCLMIPLLPNAP